MNTKLISLLTLIAACALGGERIVPATVTSETVTNVIHGNNQRGCELCESVRGDGGVVIAIYHPPHNAEPWKPADTKWTTTNVIERTTVKLEVDGLPLSFTTEKVLSSVTATWKLEQEWKQVETPKPSVTNAGMLLDGAAGLTNLILYTK